MACQAACRVMSVAAAMLRRKVSFQSGWRQITKPSETRGVMEQGIQSIVEPLLCKVGGAKRGRSEKVCCALKATPRILAVIRMLCDTSHCKGM